MKMKIDSFFRDFFPRTRQEMSASQPYIPNQGRKSVSRGFPRLTGKSLILIIKYLVNRHIDARGVNVGEGDEKYKYDIDRELGEFLYIVAQTKLLSRNINDMVWFARFINEIGNIIEYSQLYIPHYESSINGPEALTRYYQEKGWVRQK